MQITIELPDSVTIGDVTEAAGAIFQATTGYIDWELLHDGEPGAINVTGRILLDIARQLEQK